MNYHHKEGIKARLIIGLVIVIIVLLLPALGFGQITMTKKGVSGTVIYELDSMPAEKIYNKVLAYVQTHYNTPQNAQRAQVPNEMVRMVGVMESPSVIEYKKTGKGFKISREFFDLIYEIVVDIKPGKMRVTIEGSQYASSSAGEIRYGFEFVFNKDGSVKEKRMKYKTDTEAAYNFLAWSIYNYVTAKQDW
jgi:hypothetical protein